MARASIMVVLDANRSKTSVDAAEWAMKYIVRPKDTVVVLGVLSEVGKKATPCFPFNIGIAPSGIRVRLEFSVQGEISASVLEEVINKKKEEYRHTLQPLYRQCKKNKVKLEVKLAAGYDPRIITIEEAQNDNPRWVVMDSRLKKHKEYIYGNVSCNVAVMKGKKIATIMPSNVIEFEPWRTEDENIDDDKDGCDNDDKNNISLRAKEPEKYQDQNLNADKNVRSCPPASTPQSPWCPLACRTSFLKAFSLSELQTITNGFAKENLVLAREQRDVYEGIYQETPILIVRHSANDGGFWSHLDILSQVRHRSISNAIGYCSTKEFNFLVYGYLCNSTIEMTLQCDSSAKNLTWNARWCIALEIGACIRYLHEECADAPIVNISVSSANVMFCQRSYALLSIGNSAEWLKDCVPYNEDLLDECRNMDKNERLLPDFHDYGTFLIELITGKSTQRLLEEGKDQSLIDWALPFLEDGSVNQVMDPRLDDIGEAGVVHHMARAAMFCLKNDSSHKLSMSKVLAVVRGDQFVITKY